MPSLLSGGLAAGFALLIVGAAFHFVIVPVVAPGIPPQYESAPFRYWPEGTDTYMALHPLGYGFVFAAVYLGLRRWSAFPPGIRGGLVYGAGVFLVGSLPVYALAFASFAVTPEVMMSWVWQSLVQYVLAGLALAWATAGADLGARTGPRHSGVRQPARPPEPLERAD